MTGDGTAASPRTFKTIQGAANFAATLNPTYTSQVTIYIETGIYRESVMAVSDWTTFTSYPGQSVTVSGLDLVTNLTQQSAATATAPSIWKTAAPLVPAGISALTKANVLGPSHSTATDEVFVDGSMIPEPRFPETVSPGMNITSSTGIADPSVLTVPYSTQNSAGSLYDPDLAAVASQMPANWLVGAILHLQGEFTWETFAIKSFNANVLSYDSAPYTTTLSTSAYGNHFYISDFDSSNMSTTQQLNLSFTKFTLPGNIQTASAAESYVVDSMDYLSISGLTASSKVEVKQRDIVFDLSGHSGDTVNGVTLKAATIITDHNSIKDTVTNVNASYLSGYDENSIAVKVGSSIQTQAINVVTDHSGAFPNPNAFPMAPMNGWLQLDSGIQLLGLDDTLSGGKITNCFASAVTIGADGVTVSGVTISDVDVMGSDNAAIITRGESFRIMGAAGGTIPGMEALVPLDGLGPTTTYEGMVGITLALPYDAFDSQITVGSWVYVTNLSILNLPTQIAGNGTFKVVAVTSPMDGKITITYQLREPTTVAGSYYNLFPFTSNKKYGAAGTVSLVVGTAINPILVSNNVITNTGRCGITFRGAMYLTILGNTISSGMLSCNDGGGIYTFGEDTSTTTSNSYITINYNKISDMYGGYSSGVYADIGNSGLTIMHNVTYNCDSGIQINAAGINSVIEYKCLYANGGGKPEYSAFFSGIETYLDDSVKPPVWYNVDQGLHFNITAAFNTFGIAPTKEDKPVTGVSTSLYGISVTGDNPVVAYTSNTPTTNNLPVPPTVTSGPMLSSTPITASNVVGGTGFVYEDMGASIGTLYHATDIQLLLMPNAPAKFEIATSNYNTNQPTQPTASDPRTWTVSPSLQWMTYTPSSTLLDVTVNLTSRYFAILFEAASTGGSLTSVVIHGLSILGTNDLSAKATAVSVHGNGTPVFGPPPTFGSVETYFSSGPDDLMPNSYLILDLGATVNILKVDLFEIGGFTVWYSVSNSGGPWIPWTSGDAGRYVLVSKVTGQTGISIQNIGVLATA